MKTLKYFISSLIIIAFFASCEDVIDVPLNEQDEDYYMVEARITTLENPWVYISKTMPVTVDEALAGISNAIVTISNDESPAQSITLIESPDSTGYYTVPDGVEYIGMVGRTYDLRIETPEGVVITSSETLYRVEPIDSIQVRPSLRGDMRFLAVFTYGNEPEGIGDYYKWDVFTNDTLINDAQYLSFASDEFVDGNYVNSLEILTDFHDPADESERVLKYLDTVRVEQTSISPFAYNFYFQMINQASTGFLFSVPPANLPSNLTASNGTEVYGIFNAQDISISNMVIIDDEIEGQLDKSDVR